MKQSPMRGRGERAGNPFSFCSNYKGQSDGEGGGKTIELT